MTQRDELLLWYGTAEPQPETRLLHAGSLTAELVAGNLRNIRFDGIEVIRFIGYIVRDRDWGTCAATISQLSVAQDAYGFHLSYQAYCMAPDQAKLTYSAAITATSSGDLTFDVSAVPEADFETNRCGFCILHPIVGLAGAPVSVEHVDGSVEQARLPDLIEPWQPFKDMRAITHFVHEGLTATCRMEGDSFEMEDQRNWSDASYKTYVRPLALPWPYILPANIAAQQTVSLTFSGSAQPDFRSYADAEDTVIALGKAAGTMPRIGLLIAPEDTRAVMADICRLNEVNPQVLLCHFDVTAGHGLAALQDFVAIAAQTPALITLECVAPGQGDVFAELAAIAALVAHSGLKLDAIAVCPSVDRQSTPPGSQWPDCPPLSDIYAAARKAFPNIRFGGGMFSYFTELNRKRPPVALLDFVTHGTNPLVHAADDISVMQTLEALPFITRSARAIMGDKPYCIGPSTIAMRQNPYGSRTFDNPDRQRITMANSDPRQDGLFAAAWTLGYAARVLDANLDILTLAALTGPMGLLNNNAPRPVFQVVKALAGMAGQTRLACAVSQPDRLQAIAASEGQGKTGLWLANLTAQPQSAYIHGAGFNRHIDLAPFEVMQMNAAP